MNGKEFFILVEKMRKAQKTYFRLRTSMDISISKKLEKQVDDEIERVRKIISST